MGGPWWKARDTFDLLSFLGITLAYMLHINLSIAIVAMVSRNETANASQVSDVCPVSDGSPGYTVVVGEFDWSDHAVGLTLGAYYFGMALTSMVGGRAAEHFDGRLVFGLGIVVPSVLTLLSPLCSYASVYVFMVLRLLEGLVQGGIFPAMHVLIAAWIPPQDKGKHASIIFSGMPAGTVVALSVGGWLCNTDFLGGWPSVFYVFGGLGVLWGIPWFLLIHSLPENDPKISSAELEYIQTHRNYVMRDKAVPIPWRDIATSVPFWATCTANFCGSYANHIILIELPSFLNIIFHFDMNKNALGSSLPYIVQGVAVVVWSFFVGMLHSREYMTLTGSRKLSTSIGLVLSALCLLSMMWVNCNEVAAVILICLAMGFLGTMGCGAIINEQDLAPNLVGSLKGFTNTLTCTTGLLAPVITAAITSDNQSVSAWNTVFIIAAVANLLSTCVFIIFGTAQVQPWNDPKPEAVK